MAHAHKPHILVIRFSALGDVAMTVPVIYSVARRYPDVRFTVVTREFFARIFINPPANVEVMGFDLKNDYRGLPGLWRLLRRVARLRPTAVADLHNVFRSWMIDTMFRLRGTRVEMVDKMRRSRRELFRNGTPQPHFIDRYREVFARLGYPAALTFRSVFENAAPVIPLEVADRAVGIAPYARYYNKTYPVEMMRRVVELLSHAGCRTYLFGARGREAEELQQWAADITGCTAVAGRYTLEEEIAVMSKMRVMVSMDSANQHLAALAGCDVITVWGSTTPACGFTPYGFTDSDGICLGLECQPCSVAGRPTCPLGHLDCMCSISPRTIADHVLEKLK